MRRRVALCPFGIAVALPGLSAAQTEWTKYAGNPVLVIGQNPEVIRDGSLYRMWYDSDTVAGILYATSTDGVHWTEHGPTNLQPGPPGSWDDSRVAEVSVLRDGPLLKMWYSGYPDDTGANGQIGYATSEDDGLTWDKYDDPVLPVGTASWEAVSVTESCVVKEGSVYRMWYTGNDGGPIGYATSMDGISWTKWSVNPVFAKGDTGTWDAEEVDNPYVILDGGTFHMWYGGSDGLSEAIGYASSTDGVTWTRFEEGGNPVPVLEPGAPGSWEEAIDVPSVTKSGPFYRMWYNGDSPTGSIGYATAPHPTPSASHPGRMALGLLLLGGGSLVLWARARAAVG
jgi:predicted GH43/DUF377 family glycosyl hydrolase